jgi:thiol-disulfide isomerase/thioredoxin
MKKFIPTIIIAAILLSACTSKKPKTVELNGQLKNYSNNYALLISEGLIDSIVVAEDGSFTKIVELYTPAYYNLRVGRLNTTLFLSPKSSLSVTIDMDNPTEIPVFKGNTASINSYIFNAKLIFRGLFNDFKGLYSSPQDVFIEKLDSVKSEIFSLLNESQIDDKQFKELERSRIEYSFMGVMYDYPNNYALFTTEEVLPDFKDFYFIDKLDLSNSKHLNIQEYENLIYKHFQKIYKDVTRDEKNKGKSEFEKLIIYFEKIDSLVSDSKIRDYLKHSTIIETIQWGSYEVAKNIVEYYVKNAKTESYRKLVENSFEMRMLLAPGQPAPEFTLPGIDANNYSLSDFRGKLVYIDFWATWCSPCRAEIPHLKTLKEAYTDKPVVFIAISLDENRSAWENMVKSQELKGYQLHAEKAWQSEVATNYQIRGVPTFVLIDGAGNIIEYNSPRPSNPEISLMLDKHIKLLGSK